jgi:hypothetical protein
VSNLTCENGDDGNFWLTHILTGTSIAVCRQKVDGWYAAEDDSFYEEIGPFKDLNSLCDHIETTGAFGPWGSPGN